MYELHFYVFLYKLIDLDPKIIIIIMSCQWTLMHLLRMHQNGSKCTKFIKITAHTKPHAIHSELIQKEYSKRVARSLIVLGLCCPQWCLSFRVTHVSGCEGTHLSHSQGLLLQITTSICTLTLSGARSQSRCIPVCPAPCERGSVSKPSPLILTLKPPWTWWWKIRNGLEKSGGI